MPKKLSEEHKAKMKAGRERARLEKEAQLKEQPKEQPVEKQAEQPTVDYVKEEPASAPLKEPDSDLAKDVARLMMEIDELKKANPNLSSTKPEVAIEDLAKLGGQANLGAKGVQGLVYKYPIEKSYYPDPTDRLLDDPLLKRFAMRENYIFKWDVSGEIIEKYGITYAEPRFIVEIYRMASDPDTGDTMYRVTDDGTKIPQMILINRHMQHEDELAAKVIAQREGLDFGTLDDMMNEIRFLRIREWLLSLFRPAKINTFRRQARTMVIDGKAVEVFDNEVLTDHDRAVSQSNRIQGQDGVGGISV